MGVEAGLSATFRTIENHPRLKSITEINKLALRIEAMARARLGDTPALRIGRAPIFLLVPQVGLPKRLDLARDAERGRDAVPGLIVANWGDGRRE